ncbi:MAG: hypothetical protein KDD34_00765, partial [Bdellovibrionales bacterium]|nr:hypothetical protein [Bdellovibrionales bacterium]
PEQTRIFDCDWETTSIECVLFKFRWAKPHNQFYVPIQKWISTDDANVLTLQSLYTYGKIGRSGVAGITTLTIQYADGSWEDLVEFGRALYPDRVSRNGQLVLREEYDYLDFPLQPGKVIESIVIEADSWISAADDAFISMTLDHYNEEDFDRIP